MKFNFDILKQKEKSIYFGSLVLYLIAILYVYATMPDIRLMKIFNSDALYLPVFYKDIFIDKMGFWGLKFNGQPAFVPDMVIYFIIQFFTGNFLISTLLYSIFQNAVLVILIYFLTKFFFNEKVYRYATLINLFFILILFSGVFGTYLNLRFHLLCNGYHTSAFLWALTGLLFFFYYLKTNKRLYLRLIVAVTVLGVLNDKLFVLEFVIPILGVLIAQYLYVFGKRTIYVRLFITIIVSAIVGQLIFRGIETLTPLSYISQDYSVSLDKISHSIAFAFPYLWSQIAHFELSSFILLIGYISYGFSLFLILKYFRRGKDNFIFMFNVFALAFFVVVYFTPIMITGAFIYPTIFRYVIMVFFLGLINFVFFFAQQQHEKPVIISNYVLFGFIAVVLTSLVISKSFHHYLQFKPQYVTELDSIAQRNTDLKLGVAQYWKARQTSEFSDKKLKVYAVFYPKLNPELWTSSNKYWFYPKDTTSPKRVFNYIVLAQDADTVIFNDFFGSENTTLVKYGNTAILKTPEFIYDEATHLPKLLAKWKYIEKLSLYCDAEKIDKKKNAFATNVEGVILGHSVNVTTQKAHSGTHAVRLSTDSPYGFGLKLNMVKKGDRIAVSVWTSDKEVNIVLQEDTANGYYYASKKTVQKENAGWYKQEAVIEVPKSINRLKIYCYYTGKKEVYIDDISIVQQHKVLKID